MNTGRLLELADAIEDSIENNQKEEASEFVSVLKYELEKSIETQPSEEAPTLTRLLTRMLLIVSLAAFVASGFFLEGAGVLAQLEPGAWRIASIVVLLSFMIYGVISEFSEWVARPEEELRPPELGTAFGRITLRWLIRGLLVAFLAILIYAAGVVLRQPGFVAEGRVFDILCSNLPGLCQAIGLR